MADRPISDSMRGDNTHILGCEVYGGHRHYAVCLHIITRVERGTSAHNERECQRAVRCGECPAVKMRAEEKKADKALYFTERSTNPIYADAVSKRIDVLDPSYQNGWEKAHAMILRGRGVNRSAQRVVERIDEKPVNKPPIKRVATPRASEKVAAATSGNLYADLINKMMREREGGAK